MESSEEKKVLVCGTGKAAVSFEEVPIGSSVSVDGELKVVVSCRLVKADYHVKKNVVNMRCGFEYMPQGKKKKDFFTALGFKEQAEFVAVVMAKPKFVFNMAEKQFYLLEFSEPLLCFR